MSKVWSGDQALKMESAPWAFRPKKTGAPSVPCILFPAHTSSD